MSDSFLDSSFQQELIFPLNPQEDMQEMHFFGENKKWMHWIQQSSAYILKKLEENDVKTSNYLHKRALQAFFQLSSSEDKTTFLKSIWAQQRLLLGLALSALEPPFSVNRMEAFALTLHRLGLYLREKAVPLKEAQELKEALWSSLSFFIDEWEKHLMDLVLKDAKGKKELEKSDDLIHFIAINRLILEKIAELYLLFADHLPFHNLHHSLYVAKYAFYTSPFSHQKRSSGLDRGHFNYLTAIYHDIRMAYKKVENGSYKRQAGKDLDACSEGLSFACFLYDLENLKGRFSKNYALNLKFPQTLVEQLKTSIFNTIPSFQLKRKTVFNNGVLLGMQQERYLELLDALDAMGERQGAKAQLAFFYQRYYQFLQKDKTGLKHLQRDLFHLCVGLSDIGGCCLYPQLWFKEKADLLFAEENPEVARRMLCLKKEDFDAKGNLLQKKHQEDFESYKRWLRFQADFALGRMRDLQDRVYAPLLASISHLAKLVQRDSSYQVFYKELLEFKEKFEFFFCDSTKDEGLLIQRKALDLSRMRYLQLVQEEQNIKKQKELSKCLEVTEKNTQRYLDLKNQILEIQKHEHWRSDLKKKDYDAFERTPKMAIEVFQESICFYAPYFKFLKKSDFEKFVQRCSLLHFHVGKD